MAARYHSYHHERKVSAGNGPKSDQSGAAPSVTVKAGPFPGLPGKAQPRNRSLGVKKIKVYNRSEGL